MSEITDEVIEKPTERELLDEVCKHREGINAQELAEFFVRKGYPAYNVQRVMQRALDNGRLQLGEHLRLFCSQEIFA